MCVQVYKILWFLFVVSLVHAYRNNEGAAYYRPKSSYLDYELNRHKINNNNNNKNNNNRNSYQYLPHHLRHLHTTTTASTINYNNRYPNMDHVLTRISYMKNQIQLKTTENPFRKLYVIPGVTTEKGPGDDYQEIENKNEDVRKPQNTQEDDEIQDDQDDQDEDLEDDEDDYDESEADDWQAEEATEEPTEKTLTDYKWKHFGTRSRVDESFKNQGMTSKLSGDVQQAITHARNVVQLGACKTPRIRLIKIQNVYPDAGKAYIPHCTLLHRCSDETGCCRTDSLTCAPKTTERIELHFYTGRPGNYKVEKLAFYNHTECHCVEKTVEVMSSDAAPDEDRYPLRPGASTDMKTASIQGQMQMVSAQGQTVRAQGQMGSVQGQMVSAQGQTLAEPLKRCRCPELYTPQMSPRNCRCDCMEGNKDCMRIKRGKEYFALKDRLCIRKHECGHPACEFGVYIEKYGRCPRKQESLSKISSQ